MSDTDFEGARPHHFTELDHLGEDVVTKRRAIASLRFAAMGACRDDKKLRFRDALEDQIAALYANVVQHGETYPGERRAWTMPDVPAHYRPKVAKLLEDGLAPVHAEPSDPAKLRSKPEDEA